MPSVLVVDDSAVDRRLVESLLKGAHWLVATAESARTALEMARADQFDLVLTDLQMPEINGLELVASLHNEMPLLPVILMTAQGSEEIAVRALQEGAASYIPKRVLGEQLLDVARRVLSAAQDDQHQARLYSRMVRNEVDLVLENDLSLVPPLVNFLQQCTTEIGICDRSDRVRVGVALEEALVNAYFHGNLEVGSHLREVDHKQYYSLASERSMQPPYAERRIFVSARFSRDTAEYTVRDEGPGFDPFRLPDPTDPANLDRPCGRGLLLMRTFMDDVRYNAVGNEVTLVKTQKLAP